MHSDSLPRSVLFDSWGLGFWLLAPPRRVLLPHSCFLRSPDARSLCTHVQYEKRIRDNSTLDKVFDYFSSHTRDGVKYMTPLDLLGALGTLQNTQARTRAHKHTHTHMRLLGRFLRLPGQVADSYTRACQCVYLLQLP